MHNLKEKINEIVQNEIKKVIKEYYELLTNTNYGVSKIDGNIDAHIYSNDRENYPPHIHIVDKSHKLEFEVRVLDLNVSNVKGIVNKNTFKIISNIMKKLHEWLHYKLAKSNEPYFMYMFSRIDEILRSNKIKSNLLVETKKWNKNICNELKEYIKIVYDEEVK